MVRFAAMTVALVIAATPAAVAQDPLEPPQNIAFEGGTFTITQNDDFEKVLAFDGREIARNYMMFHDGIVKVGETSIALFSVGDGGNACGAAQVIAWKPKDGELSTTVVGDDCDGAPPAAVTEAGLYFVPYVAPGGSLPVRFWSPEGGLRVSGMLTFAPQPGTGWNTLDPEKLDGMVDAFDNAGVYDAAQALLGDRLGDVVAGLFTGGQAEKQNDGTITGYGCVPHACGVSDTFMAIDPKARKLFFAQQSEAGAPKAWPPLADWPAGLKSMMQAAIQGEQ